MTITFTTVLLVCAFVLVLCEALGVPSTRVKLGWLGLALWLLAAFARV